MTGQALPDIRLAGFAGRTPLPEACAWIDAHAVRLGPEAVAVGAAIGRVSAEAWVSQADWPSVDAAAVDGYAVRAADSEGASSYNPLPLALLRTPGPGALPPGGAILVAAGTPLPGGADAVLPFEAAQRSAAAMLEVTAPVARGAGVDRRGSELRAGMQAVPASRRLRPQDVALLAANGVARVAVTRRPRVRLVVPGPKAGHDALTPMLRALVARDGGCVEACPSAGAGRAALVQALARPATGTDLVVVAGRSGSGIDDEAPLAVAEAGGRLDLHGIAVRPGGSAGLGRLGAPLLLLPGTPLACLAAYDMLAGRALRRLGGRPAALPYRVTDAVLDRKIVSAIGFTDLVRVRLAGSRAAPLGAAESGGLAGAVRADGFVIVPEASEGHAPGSAVRVHLYDDRCGDDGA